MENHLGLTWKSEANVLGMNIKDVLNIENFISQELKGYEQSHLEAVAYNPHRQFLRLYFSKEPSKKAKNYVKEEASGFGSVFDRTECCARRNKTSCYR